MPISILIIQIFVLAVIIGYYGFFATRLTTVFVNWAGSKFNFSHKYSHFEITATFRLASAGIQQMLLFFLLFYICQLTWTDIVPQNLSLSLLLMGGFLGIGEMALVSFICTLMMRFTKYCFPDKAPKDYDEWYVISQGGWMRSYYNALKILPLPLASILILLYIVFEEAIFRGLIINGFEGFGLWSILLSTVPFVWVQTFNTPGWKNAVFPVMGSTVMGVIHGLLYFYVRDLVPLIAAHYVMFFAATFRVSKIRS